jgi:hypothetical protein
MFICVDLLIFFNFFRTVNLTSNGDTYVVSVILFLCATFVQFQ